MKSAAFQYERPASLEGALQILSENEGARPMAGNQSLGPMLNLRLAEPDLVVDISRLPELRRIEDSREAIVVGAGVRHADFEDGRVPDVLGGLLARVARGIAYRAVRNRGTIGGSLAHADPAADWPTIIIALGATLQVRSVRAERVIPASELITGALTTSISPDELIESIRIPRFDPARAEVRAVLSGNGLSPVIMTATGRAFSTGINSNGASVIKEAVRDDLEAHGFQELPSYESKLYQTSMVRAALGIANA